MDIEGVETKNHLKYSKDRDRVTTRTIDELVGIARGVIADDVLNKKEVAFLERWLTSNKPHIEDPFVNHLMQRIKDILKDGFLDDSEAAELFETLSEFTGENTGAFTQKSTSLPLNDPPPNVVFEGNIFCLTGTFVCGDRRAVTKLIEDRNGAVHKSVVLKTDYLVIGTYATDAWSHSTYGKKITKAIDYRDRTGVLKIISEKHFTQFL